LPIGTINVFATELGLPSSDLKQCWQIICDGHTRTIDLPNANGKHFVQLAGIGLDVSDRPAHGVRMLTEVALGRATDHLYQALPKAVRRELADLPETIRRLEQDATKLRASIDSLDDHLAVFERSTMHGGSRGLACF